MKRLLTALLFCGLILLAGCAGTPRQEEDSWELVEENTITFSDGEHADLWHREHRADAFYKLSDGTILLRIDEPIGPQNVYVGGLESFDDLSASAQEAVSAYYEEQGLLYDTQAQLEDAYATYLDCQKAGTEYQERYIRQDVSPTAGNDTIMCFLTTVTLPVEGENERTVSELRLGAIFDRSTGEALELWDLFTVPEEEVRQRLLDESTLSDSVPRSELEAALKPEYVVLLTHDLEITFPRGSLPSQEYTSGASVDYSALQDVLQPWAVPDSEGETG